MHRLSFVTTNERWVQKTPCTHTHSHSHSHSYLLDKTFPLTFHSFSFILFVPFTVTRTRIHNPLACRYVSRNFCVFCISRAQCVNVISTAKAQRLVIRKRWRAFLNDCRKILRYQHCINILVVIFLIITISVAVWWTICRNTYLYLFA